MMRHLALAALIAALPSLAQAACYADYKAKQDGPLRLHYGVMKVSDAACGNKSAATAEVRARLQANGWQLLRVMGTFGDKGLDKRKESAGSYFLRY